MSYLGIGLLAAGLAGAALGVTLMLIDDEGSEVDIAFGPASLRLSARF